MNYRQTDLVRLRCVEPEDGETFRRWNQDSEMARNPDFVRRPVSIAQASRRGASAAQKKLEGDGFHWVIEDGEGTQVGSIQTRNCHPRSGVFKYGVGIDARHRWKGNAAAAMLPAPRHYFQELRYQKADGQMHSENEASRALHERLGFEREGTIRRAVFRRGRRPDEFCYGLTSEEWARRYGEAGP